MKSLPVSRQYFVSLYSFPFTVLATINLKSQHELQLLTTFLFSVQVSLTQGKLPALLSVSVEIPRVKLSLFVRKSFLLWSACNCAQGSPPGERDSGFCQTFCSQPSFCTANPNPVHHAAGPWQGKLKIALRCCCVGRCMNVVFTS